MLDYFDIDQDGYLNYTEFMQMVLPCDNLLLRSDASQREPRPRDSRGYLNGQVEMILAEFLDREVSLHMSMEKLKQDMHTRRDFNLVDAFNTIDIT